jgi:hypothetical protein
MELRDFLLQRFLELFGHGILRVAYVRAGGGPKTTRITPSWITYSIIATHLDTRAEQSALTTVSAKI